MLSICHDPGITGFLVGLISVCLAVAGGMTGALMHRQHLDFTFTTACRRGFFCAPPDHRDHSFCLDKSTRTKVKVTVRNYTSESFDSGTKHKL
jgi:hypothetical protein